MKAVIAYQKRLNSLTSLPKAMKLNKEMENKRKIIMRRKCSSKESELEAGAEFLEVRTKLNTIHTIMQN